MSIPHSHRRMSICKARRSGFRGGLNAGSLLAIISPRSLDGGRLLALRSLNQLRWLRRAVVAVRRTMLEMRLGVDVHPSATVSLTSRFVNRRRHARTVGGGT